MDYQAIFDQTFPTFDDEEKYGRYGQLVYTLEAVFKAAGYDITGAELAGDHHNQICGAIGQTNLPEIANHFIGWVTVVTLEKYLHNFPDYSYGGGYRDWRLSAYTLGGWNEFLKAQKKQRGIGNNTEIRMKPELFHKPDQVQIWARGE